MAAAGGGVLEMAQDWRSYDDKPRETLDLERTRQHVEMEWRWMEHVSRDLGIPILSGLVTGMDPSTHLAFRDSASLNLQRLEQANGNGAQIYTQAFIRPQAVVMSWRDSGGNFSLSPTYMALKPQLMMVRSTSRQALMRQRRRH